MRRSVTSRLAPPRFQVRAPAGPAWHALPVRTERGFDRIVNFSDATVAIAMTLLVLPLVELGGEVEEDESVWDLLAANGYAIFGFVLSFLVIWSMWVNHHRVMEYFADYDSTLMALHLIWLLTMVSIPFTTKLLTNPHLYDHGATALYVSVLLVTSIALHALGSHGRRQRKLLHEGPEVEEWLAAPYRWTTVATLALVLVIVVIFPSLGAWPMLLLFVDGLVESWLDRRRKVPAS
jgi:uncharacterized membrane protein